MWEIDEENKKKMSAFMTDFWQMIKKSYTMPDDGDEAEHDHYWTTLVHWADALGKKYDCDPVISAMVCGYIDGQSIKSNNQRVEIKVIDN